MKVPWMSKKAIARKAEALVEDFQRRAGYTISPPIPVEEIIERSLGLEIHYVELEKILGIRDVLGATYAKSKRVLINERLFEQGSEGRLVFTCAHEAGHWVLHRRYVDSSRYDGPGNDAIVSKELNSREPVEWQADYFASCLLMPEKHVKEAFHRICGAPFVVIKRERDAVEDSSCEAFAEQWPYIATAMCEAGGFSNVSRQAMIIRLQDLGLIVNRTGKMLDWDVLCSNR
ncbi:MAG TPA: ImmA/IrrE family metallo-endopeptidase [Desulfobacteraceae bacterium]|nr:ImmA/IrrE family metallo-endopeptidase [Desulfobacteraceae bacterium]